MSLPLGLLFGKYTQFFDNNGVLLADGSLQFYVAGTSTPQAVYADSSGLTSLGTTVALDASARPSNGSSPTGVYLSPTGYKVVLLDSASTTVITQDHVEFSAEAALATLANLWSEGRAASGTITVADTDNLIRLTAASTVNLQAAASRGGPLFLINYSGASATVQPNGSETITTAAGVGGSGAAYTLATGASMILLSDGISNYFGLVTT